MPIMIQNSKTKLMCEGDKITKMYCEGDVIYSSGNIVMYMVDSGVTYQEEVDEGESCLNPASFTPSKNGWEFVGWRSDLTASSDVYSNYLMGDSPITLYAVFKQTITLTTIANSVTSKQNKDRLYNNGATVNPVFTVANPSKSGASFLGWSSSASSATVSNTAISNLSLSASTTRYAVFKYPNSSTYTLGTTTVEANQQTSNNPNTAALSGAPTINTNIYGSLALSIGNSIISINSNSGAYYRSLTASIVVGSNSYTLGVGECSAAGVISGDTGFRTQSVSMNLTAAGNQTIYLKGYIAGGNGFCKGTVAFYSGSLVLYGRTVVG